MRSVKNWSRVKRIAFRFAAMYFVLYALPFPFRELWQARQEYDRIAARLLPRIDALFGEQDDVGHFMNEKLHAIPGIKDTFTMITFRAFG